MRWCLYLSLVFFGAVRSSSGVCDLLNKAAELGTEEIRKLVSSSTFDPGAENQRTIWWAAKKGYVDVVELLLRDRRVDPGANSQAPLKAAIFFERVEVVKLLLSDSRVDPGGDEQDVIQNAASYGNAEVVELLLNDHRVDPSANNQNSLTLAARLGYVEVVKLLLLHPRVDPTADDQHALRRAAENGHREVVELLLQRSQVKPSVRALGLAVRRGHVKVVELLLQDGRIDPRVNGQEAIQLAADIRSMEIIKLLLQDPRVDPSAGGQKAIQAAAASGCTETVKLLLQDSRADPSVGAPNAFMRAVSNGHAAVVGLLLEDIRVDPGAAEQSALRSAAAEGHAEVVELLLKDPRVDPNHPRAILSAARFGHEKVVGLLLQDPRADPSASRLEAIGYADVYGHEHIVRLLLQDGPGEPDPHQSQGQGLEQETEAEDELPFDLDDFVTKIAALRSDPEMGSVPKTFKVELSRSSLLEEAAAIFLTTPVCLLKWELKIEFAGEDGADAGGLKREFFTLVSSALSDPALSLFESSAASNYALQIHPHSLVNLERWYLYRLTGRIIGMAIFHQLLLGVRFGSVVLKSILGQPIGWEDLREMDRDLYTHIQSMQSGSVDEWDLTFSVPTHPNGQLVEVDLFPGGSEYRVTDLNKRRYMAMLTEFYLVSRFREQLDTICEGVYEIVPKDLLQSLTWQELQYLLAGAPKIDIDDWKRHTEHIDCSPTDPVVVRFWDYVSTQLDESERASLLQFATGSPSVPVTGFKDLQGPGGLPRRFTIMSSQVPGSPAITAHTCFNRIVIPQHTSEEQFVEHMQYAIRNNIGFGKL